MVHLPWSGLLLKVTTDDFTKLSHSPTLLLWWDKLNERTPDLIECVMKMIRNLPMGLDPQLGSSRYLARARSKMLKLYQGIRIGGTEVQVMCASLVGYQDFALEWQLLPRYRRGLGKSGGGALVQQMSFKFYPPKTFQSTDILQTFTPIG